MVPGREYRFLRPESGSVALRGGARRAASSGGTAQFLGRNQQASRFRPGILAPPQDLLALVTDQQFEVDVPHFGLDDARGVADLMERRFGLAPTRTGTATRD